jgi:sugar (pentulose or hexulose) kinase
VVESEVIGIDLGGTAIKLGRFHKDGNCVQSLTVATPQPATPTAVVEAITQAITQLNANPPVLQRLVWVPLAPLMQPVGLPELPLTYQAGKMSP